MSTNITSDNPLQAPDPASPKEVGDVKPETSAHRVSEKILLRVCNVAMKQRKAERFKNRVAQRIVEVESLHAAKQRCYANLQAQPHVGLDNHGGSEHSIALEAYEAASEVHDKAKKRLGVLKELLEKMENDTIIQEYLVKGD